MPTSIEKIARNLASCAAIVLAVVPSHAVAQRRVDEPPPVTSPTGITTIDPVPPAPPAPELEDKSHWSPSFIGSYFTRYELRHGYDNLGISSATSRPRFLEGDSIFYRARFGVGTGLFDVGNGLKVGLQFNPQATGVFGNLTTSPNAPNTIVDAQLGLHEGYLRVVGKHTRFDAGRFEMVYGDAMLVGNNDWNEIGRSFDGMRARFSSDSRDPTLPWVDLFATVLDEGRADLVRGGTLDQAPGVGLGDVYFAGIYAALGSLLRKNMELDVYQLLSSWSRGKDYHTVIGDTMSPTWNRQGAIETTIGARAKERVGSFDYRLETGVQAGSRPGAAPPTTAVDPIARVLHNRVRAGQFDLELGFTVLNDRLRGALEFVYASGDKQSSKRRDEGWDELFPTGHKFLGLSDAWVQNGVKRTNTESAASHWTLRATEALTLQLDGYLYARPQRNPQTYNERGFAAGELDIGSVYMLAKGLKVRATYTIFVPNRSLYRDQLARPGASTSADPVHWLELELRYDLKN